MSLNELQESFGLKEMDQPLLSEVFSAWCRQLNGNSPPPVDSLDAEHFLRYSRNLVVCDVHPDGDVEFRIAGENIVAAKGSGLKGLRTSTLQLDIGKNPSLNQFSEVVEAVAPRYYDGPAYNFQKDFLRCQRLLLPFVDEVGKCRKILGVMVYGPASVEQPR